MRATFAAVLLILGLSYPLIVYFGVQHVTPAMLSVVLFVLTIAKYAIDKDRRNIRQITLLALGLVYSLALMISNNAMLLRLYPAVISVIIAALFAFSLKQKTSLIEHVSLLAGKTITPNAKRYTWYLTLIWSVILSVNAGIALYLAVTAPLERWAFYCGFLCYIIFGAIFGLEYAYRRYFISRYGA